MAVAACVFMGVLLWFVAKSQRATEAKWRAVAERYGLVLEPGPERVSGQVDGLAIEAHTYTSGSGDDEIEDDWTLVDGVWKARFQGYLEKSLAEELERALGLARAFSIRPADRPRLLRERATLDPEAGVRARALDVLVEAYPEHDETVAALDAARVDEDANVRLAAARVLTDVELLGALVDARDVDVTPSALDALAERAPTHPVSVASLDRLFPDLTSGPAPLRAAILKALTRIERPWGEDAGLRLLDDREDAVRLEAIRALGHVGTIARAVPALVPLRDKFLGGSSKDLARDAILRIQARAGSPDAGGLMVVEEGAEGGLTLGERAPATASS